MKTSISGAKTVLVDRVLTERFLKHPFYQEAKTIATCLSSPLMNFKRQELIKRMLKDSKEFWIPKTSSQRHMDFVVYHPRQLVKTSLVLLEPLVRLRNGWEQRLRLT